MGASAVTLTVLLGGCGWHTPTATMVAPTSYTATIIETVPSSPQPIQVTWKGTLPASLHRWTHLTEQIGQTPVMTLIPGASNAKTTVLKTPALKPATASTLLRELGLWDTIGSHTWPIKPFPTVNVVVHEPLTVSSGLAHLQHQWHASVTIQGVTLPATESLAATIARPQGILQSAHWTLVITTNAQHIVPKKGAAYWFPALSWTEQGTVTGH